MKSKKGQVAQIFFILAMLLFFAIFGMICLKIGGLFNTGLIQAMNQSSVNTDQAQQALHDIQRVSVPAIDYFIFFFFLFGNIGLMLGAVKTKFSPVITFIWIFMLLLAIFISSGLVNIYQEFAHNPEMLNVSVQMHLTNILFSRYMPCMICAIGGIIIMTMYSRSGSDL